MSAMTVQQLIEALSDFDPEAEVRLATQPNYPFEYEVSEVASLEDAPQVCEDCGSENVKLSDDGKERACLDCESCQTGDDLANDKIVYLGEGRQLGYLPGRAARALGWKE